MEGMSQQHLPKLGKGHLLQEAERTLPTCVQSAASVAAKWYACGPASGARERSMANMCAASVAAKWYACGPASGARERSMAVMVTAGHRLGRAVSSQGY